MVQFVKQLLVQFMDHFLVRLWNIFWSVYGPFSGPVLTVPICLYFLEGLDIDASPYGPPIEAENGGEVEAQEGPNVQPAEDMEVHGRI